MKKIEISFEKKSSIKICGLQFGVEDSLSTIDSIHVKTEKKKRGSTPIWFKRQQIGLHFELEFLMNEYQNLMNSH